MPTFAQLDRAAQIDAVNSELGRALQTAGLAIVPADAFETAQDYRAAQIRRLQETLPATVHGTLRGHISPSLRELAPDVVSKVERNVIRATAALAHQSPEMRSITTIDQAGRKTTEFVGGCGSWMNQFRAQPRLMRKLGDVQYG